VRRSPFNILLVGSGIERTLEAQSGFGRGCGDPFDEGQPVRERPAGRPCPVAALSRQPPQVGSLMPRIDIEPRQRGKYAERHSISFFADRREQKSVELGISHERSSCGCHGSHRISWPGRRPRGRLCLPAGRSVSSRPQSMRGRRRRRGAVRHRPADRVPTASQRSRRRGIGRP